MATLALTVLANSSFAAGLLTPTNSGLPALKIKSHNVDVSVNGAYITTSVEQVFHNPNDQTLEAIYSFPVPEHAAVGDFTYWVDGKPVIGEVVEKKRAREIYEQEKQAGREAAIVEKDEYKTFDISVTPVLPKSDVKIRLVYVQSAYVNTSVGRYVYPLEEGGVDEQKLAFWERNEVVEENFSFNFHLQSGYPVDGLRLPKHPQASINKITEEEWKVSMGNTTNVIEEGQTAPTQTQAAMTLDQDIVVYWRLQDGLPGAVDLVTYKEESGKRGTFMMTLTPGDDLAKIQSNRDWIFVLDVSGSMQGKYATLAEGVRQALTRLPEHDRFRVIVFNNHAQDLSRGFHSATQQNINATLKAVENYQPNGGTNLYAGLKMAMSDLDADSATGVVLVTDGVANVGTTEKVAFLKLLKKHDVRLFTFIMGNSANRPLLEEMTTVSNGFALSISNSDDVVGPIMQASSKLTHQALRNIKINMDGVRTANVIPDTIGSLYRGEQLVILGHYYGAGELDLELTGSAGAEKRKYQTRIMLPERDVLHPEIERLWGYAKVQQLKEKMDYLGEDADSKQAIVDVATEFGLVTDYTSMLVVRDEVFDQLNIARSNKARVEKEQQAKQQRAQQPLPKQRADNQAPMYPTQNKRPSMSGGGGATGPWFLIGLIMFTAMAWTRKNAKS